MPQICMNDNEIREMKKTISDVLTKNNQFLTGQLAIVNNLEGGLLLRFKTEQLKKNSQYLTKLNNKLNKEIKKLEAKENINEKK